MSVPDEKFNRWAAVGGGFVGGMVMTILIKVFG